MRSPDANDGRAAAALTVDYGELARLAVGLRSLAQEMSDRNGTLQDAIEDPSLYAAFLHAERDWQRHRIRLREFLRNTARTLDEVALAYQDVDTQLATAARPAAQATAQHAGGPHARPAV